MQRILALAATLLLAADVHAAYVTIDYTVPVVSLTLSTNEPPWYGEVETAQLGNLAVSVGEIVTGRFTYDDATPLAPYPTGGFWTDAVTHTIRFGNSGTVVQLDSSRHLYTGRGSGLDSLGVTTGNSPVTPDMPGMSALILYTAPLGTHAPETLPRAEDWQYYESVPGTGLPLRIYMNIGNEFLVLEGGAGTFQVISGVPEPGTYAMLAAGLGLIGVAARRRKSTAA